MGLSIKKNTRFVDFCADRIDVITNFAIMMNVIIERAHCITVFSAVLYLQGYFLETF